MAVDQEPAPTIDLRTGHRQAPRTRAVTKEEDAPRYESTRSPSWYIEDGFRAAGEIGERAAQGMPPTDDQMRRLQEGVVLVRTMRARLDQALNGGGWKPLFIAVAAAFGINLGFDSFGASGAQAQAIAEAKVKTERAAEDIAELRKRQDDSQRLEEKRDRAVRHNIGLTVRWLGDEQDRHCRNNQAIADGLNLLLRREFARRGEDDEFTAIRINCDASRLIPPELEELRAAARRDLGQ